MHIRLTGTLVALGVLCAPVTMTGQAAVDPLAPYVAFIDRGHQDPVDYVLSLFEEHDLVILCERAHPEATQYELILEVVRDPRFTRRVGHVFTEVGLRNLQPALDELWATPGLEKERFGHRLIPIYRDITIHPIWNRANFFDFLASAYEWNRRLDPDRRIEVIFTDVALSWPETDTESYAAFRRDVVPERDRRMAERIIERIRALREAGDPRPRGLVIMNYRHAFNDVRFDDGALGDNVGRYLFEAFPGRVANVLLNSVAIRLGSSDQAPIMAPIQGGIWDAAIRKAGLSSVGFDLAGSPFGRDQFDFFPVRTETVTYEDVFTGFVFHRHLPEHRFVDGVPGLVDAEHLPELRRRFRATGADVTEAELEELRAMDRRGSTYDGLEELETEIRRWLEGGSPGPQRGSASRPWSS